ncbi:MAG: hypothetical protein KAJ52_09240 [Sedimentisphaerales bacterium]|nr:hypothetical protein [Sedimentisphaerales bacterium]
MHTRQNLAVSLVLAISMVGISYGADGILPGDGLSESTAYLIEDLADFDVFADPNNSATYWSSGVYTKLTCDPNLTGRPYTTAVIAPDTPDTDWQFNGIPFEGIFDGNGHIVRNLTIDTASAGNDYLGLFGEIEGSSAQVKNLGIENINITGGADSKRLGGLCGFNASGTITNCYLDSSVTGGDNSRALGGLCGYNYYGTITNCYAAGLVTGGADSRDLGGLCGYNRYGTITNCYAAGLVTGGADSCDLGGLCGYNYRGIISNCYATGSVTGMDDSGALGGLCGYNYYGTITNCYFYLFSGLDNSFGTALDNLQMQNAASFAGFDFTDNSNDGNDDYWTIINGHCPKLAWQTDNGPLVPTPPVTTLFGSGYSLDPFQINSCADFTEFRTNSNLRYGYYILTVDINLTCETFSAAVIEGVFGGHFDGNGHIIRNITIDTAGANNSHLGLFSKIYYASVSNLGIENINITGGDDSDYLGGLCGYNRYGSTITNCYATGSVTGGADSRDLGGLCGKNNGTITNCYANGSVTGGDNSGLLGGLCGYSSGTINNCYAAGSVTGEHYLGGLCGSNCRSTITNCYANGLVTGGYDSFYLGGLCGYNEYGTITNCYAVGSVIGGAYSRFLGGLCGNNSSTSTIINCYATGSVNGGANSYYLGVLCGYNYDGTIANCYATGSVNGGDNSYSLGGLCGRNRYGTITNCYAIGSVTGGYDSFHLGGLCGYEYSGTISNCFWDVETSGIGSEGDNNYGATGKTTEQMQTQSTFTDANWDFTVVPVWHMPFQAVGYPMLGWQKDIPGDFTGRYGVYMDDFAVLSNAWLSTDTPTTNWNEHCDLNANGVIDPGDLTIFAENWLCD